MYRLLILIFLLSTSLFATIKAVVSIPPQKLFLEAIAGERVETMVMVAMGNSPHTYEPKPSQMVAISKADLYFTIGVEFEKVWLEKFKALNRTMEIVALDEGIKKITMRPKTACNEESHDHDHHHPHHDGIDPHLWTTPKNVKLIAMHIYEKLINIDPSYQPTYAQNLKEFLKDLEALDQEIRQTLEGIKSRNFMVFHPSWGYFANTYNLVQIPVEMEGKNPSPKQITALIKEAKSKAISAIFTQPEFSDIYANMLSKELHIPVVKLSPLSMQWRENLLRIASSIANGQKE
jgi:zinc transport system substrate-binding protein